MSPLRLILDREEAPAPAWVYLATWAILGAAFSLFCWFVLILPLKNWDVVWQYRVALWNGWLLTIGLSALALVLSLVIGLATALARRSRVVLLKILATFYVETVRGMPLLVLLLVGYYVVAHRMGLEDRIPVGVALLSLFSGSYIAEIMRAGMDSVGKSQLESARAIGLSPAQTYRYVIFPQALRQTLPPLAGQFASLIKDSSLLMILGISEFTYSAQQVNSATLSTLECLLPLAPGYLILTLPISFWARSLERKFHYET